MNTTNPITTDVRHLTDVELIALRDASEAEIETRNLFLNIAEAAVKVGTSARTIQRYIERGKLPAARENRPAAPWLIKRSDLLAWAQATPGIRGPKPWA